MLAEIEKIWIKHDINEDKLLNLIELSQYLDKTGFPERDLSDHQIKAVFSTMDNNGDKGITKEEMFLFFDEVIEML